MLPSSFEHDIGQIRYTLTGTINIPWSFDKHTRKSFTVINHVDLNKFNPILRQPIEVSESKIIFLSNKSPINGFLNIKKGS